MVSIDFSKYYAKINGVLKGNLKMSEEERLKKLETMLKELKETVRLYNELNPQGKIEIVPSLEDVSQVVICTHDDGHIGLFKKINCFEKVIGNNKYKIGTIYKGMDSSCVALKTFHKKSAFLDYFMASGTGVCLENGSYVANCVIDNEMSFDDMRQIMRDNGEIESFQYGKASKEEMVFVLAYATKYYNLSSEKLKREKNDAISRK